MPDLNPSTPTITQVQTPPEPSLEVTLRNLEEPAVEPAPTPEPTPTPNEPAPTEPTSLLSDADVARLTAAYQNAQAAPATPAVAPREYTQEEVDKLLNVFHPTDELLVKLSDPATMKEGLAELVGGIRKEYNTLLQVQLATMKKQFDTDYSPVKEAAVTQAAEKAETAFYGAHPDLAGEQGKAVVNLVMQALINNGALRDKSPADRAKLLAGEARATLKKLGVSGGGSSTTQPTQQSSSSRRTPAALSNGSTAGAQNTPAPATGGVADQLRNLGL